MTQQVSITLSEWQGLGKRAYCKEAKRGTWSLGDSEQEWPPMILVDSDDVVSACGLYWYGARAENSAGYAKLNDKDRILAIRPAFNFESRSRHGRRAGQQSRETCLVRYSDKTA